MLKRKEDEIWILSKKRYYPKSKVVCVHDKLYPLDEVKNLHGSKTLVPLESSNSLIVRDHNETTSSTDEFDCMNIPFNVTQSIYPTFKYLEREHVYEFPIIKYVFKQSKTNKQIREPQIHILVSYLEFDPDCIKRAVIRKFTCFGGKHPRLISTETPHILSDNLRTTIWIEPHPYRVLDVSKLVTEYKLKPGSLMFKLAHIDLMAFFALIHFRETGGNPKNETRFLENYVYFTRPKDLYLLFDEELVSYCTISKRLNIIAKAKSLKVKIIKVNHILNKYDKFVDKIFNDGKWQNHKELSSILQDVFENPEKHNLCLSPQVLNQWIIYRNDLKKRLAILLSVNTIQKACKIFTNNQKLVFELDSPTNTTYEQLSDKLSGSKRQMNIKLTSVKKTKLENVNDSLCESVNISLPF